MPDDDEEKLEEAGEPELEEPSEPKTTTAPETEKGETDKETEKTDEEDDKTTPEKVRVPGAKKGWFQKIPAEVRFSPGGFLLIGFAIFMEVLDWIIPLDGIFGIFFELIFIVMLVILAKVSLKSCLIPFLLERIPILSDILPTWFLRMLS